VDYALSKYTLSSEKHFVCSNNVYSWVDDIPAHIMTYDSDYLQDNCIRTSLYLVGKNYDDMKGIEQYAKVLSHFKEKFPLSSIIPHDIFKARSKEIIARVEAHLSTPSYYDTDYARHTKLFNCFERAHVDTQRISYHSTATDVSNRTVLATFLPDKDGLCRPVKYDRLSSRTGRLKTASGPSILTLKNTHRDILRSRFKNGKIISIDFSSLEARIFLYSAGVNETADDIYSSIAQKLFAEEYPRHIVKAVVISLLYGMGEGTLSLKLNLDKAKVRKIIRDIKKYFKYDVVKSKLESSRTKSGIANHYGRVVEVPDDRLLINTFVQSTGVDVVLHGFVNIIEVAPKEDFVPLFILHDALIVDVSENCNLEFIKVGENIPGFTGHYPVHVNNF
jgi:hypothetical protein